MAHNDLRLLVRDRGAMFFTFIFPALLAIFFGMVFGGDGPRGKMPVVVIDQDQSEVSRAFVADFVASDGVNVTTTDDRARGEQAVRGGKAVACVIVPKGFGEAGARLMTGESTKLEMLTDPTRTSEAGLLTGRLSELAFKRIFAGFTDPATFTDLIAKGRASLAESTSADDRRVFGGLFDSLDVFSKDLDARKKKREADAADGGATKAAKGFEFKPLEFTTTSVDRSGGGMPRKSYEFTFPQGVVWGLMGCVAAFGTALASERQRGTLLRLSTAPVSRGSIIVGKALGCFIACVSVQALLLAMSIVVFGVVVSSWLVMLVAIVFSSLGFVGIMMALAGLSRSEAGAGGIGRAIVIILAMIGGGTIPLFVLPESIQRISGVSPFKWALIAFEGGLWRQFSMQDMLVPCVALVGFGVVGFVVGVIGFARSRPT
ncbi:MAG: ABC transporter permease [Planctomycetota bacterium]|nr:ABC transporter permease [Planctomycetota bacterium]